MEIIFADYDTVKMDGSYDVRNEVFSFNYNGRIYNIKDFNENIHNLKILLILMELENTKIKSEKRKVENDASLLEKARNGNIRSTEAKKIYLSELKKVFLLFHFTFYFLYLFLYSLQTPLIPTKKEYFYSFDWYV